MHICMCITLLRVLKWNRNINTEVSIYKRIYTWYWYRQNKSRFISSCLCLKYICIACITNRNMCSIDFTSIHSARHHSYYMALSDQPQGEGKSFPKAHVVLLTKTLNLTWAITFHVITSGVGLSVLLNGY